MEDSIEKELEVSLVQLSRIGAGDQSVLCQANHFLSGAYFSEIAFSWHHVDVLCLSHLKSIPGEAEIHDGRCCEMESDLRMMSLPSSIAKRVVKCQKRPPAGS